MHERLREQGGQADRGAAGRPHALRPDGARDQLAALVQPQTEITQRTERISPPGKLKALHQILVQGQLVRLAGVEQVRDGLIAALNGKNKAATAKKLAALSGYFTGPDVYYNELFYRQAQQAMAADGVSNVAVPAVELLLAQQRLLARAPCRRPWRRSRRRPSSPACTGVGLGGVAVTQQRQDDDADGRAHPPTSSPRSACWCSSPSRTRAAAPRATSGEGHHTGPGGARRRRPSRRRSRHPAARQAHRHRDRLAASPPPR